ncbi:hypothetical protein ABT104_30140 [Streptomyces mobaraensis]
MGEELYRPADEEVRARNAMPRSLGEDDLYTRVTGLRGARDFTLPRAG